MNVWNWVAISFIALSTILALRAARCNFREWRECKGKPMIRDGGRGIIERSWFTSRGRFPNPGTPGDWRMDERQCQVYAHLADVRRRWHDGIVLGGNILAAALLGLALFQVDAGEVWAAVGDNRVELGVNDTSQPAFFGSVQTFFTDERMRWTMWTTLAMAALFAGRSLGQDHFDRRDAYRRAADRQREEKHRARTSAPVAAQQAAPNSGRHRLSWRTLSRLVNATWHGHLVKRLSNQCALSHDPNGHGRKGRGC